MVALMVEDFLVISAVAAFVFAAMLGLGWIIRSHRIERAVEKRRAKQRLLLQQNLRELIERMCSEDEALLRQAYDTTLAEYRSL